MASIADTLRAFEARAERALVQDLRQMAKDTGNMKKQFRRGPGQP